MCTVRDSLRTQGTDTTKLEKLMSKIGIFSALYIVPAVVLIICESYHAFVLLEWQPAVTGCKIAGGGCRRPINKPQVYTKTYDSFYVQFSGVGRILHAQHIHVINRRYNSRHVDRFS